VTRRRIPKLTLTQPASIVVSDGKDSYQISASGFQQGDPLSSLLFSLSIPQTLEDLHRALKGHGDFLLLLYYPSPHSPLLPPFPPAMFSSSAHHALFIRTPRHNRTQSKRIFSPPIPPLRFLFQSKRPDLPFCVFFLPAETLEHSQHSQLEEISMPEPFDALHPASFDWTSFSNKAGRDCYINYGTQEKQKLKKRQPVVSITSFLFAVWL
jgi:hypothetical protein